MKAMINYDLDMPMVDALDRKCKTLATFLPGPRTDGGKYNARQLVKETQADVADMELANVDDAEE